jgi:hypothetical protein
MEMAVSLALCAAVAGAFVPAKPAVAAETAASKAIVPIADAKALTDSELGSIRGAGFVDDLVSTIAGAVSASVAGILAGMPSAAGLPGAFPNLYFVQAQINDQPTITLVGVTPQQLSLSGPGYSIELSAGVPITSQALASVQFAPSAGVQTTVTALAR